MNNSLTLKLTSQNLYDLIDSNEQFKLKICNGILENISKRYIKDHLNAISNEIDKIIAVNVKEMFSQCVDINNTNYYNYNVTLKTQFAEKIQKSIEEEVNNFINNTVENTINNLLTIETIENISDQIYSKLDQKINEKIDNAINVRINRILGVCNEINNTLTNI